MPHLSVIIPTWNRASETERAVQSVLSQTFQDFEVIIADDGSTDSTPLKFKDCPDPRVHYLQLEHSGLPAVARNAGLQQAQGEYAAFLDSDDEWLPYKLERQVEFLQQNPEIGMVCANAWIRRENIATPVTIFHAETIGSQEWPLAELVKTNIIITSSLMANRQSILAAGGFPQDPIFKAIEDYALWLRLTVKNRLYYLAEPLLFYADVGNSIRSQQRIEDNTKGLKRLFDELAIYTRSEPSPVKKNISIRQAGCLKDQMRIVSAKGKIKEVVNVAKQILALEPGNIGNYKLILISIFQALQQSN